MRLTGWIQTVSYISPDLWGCSVGGMTLTPSWCQFLLVHSQPHRREDSKQSWADSIPGPCMWPHPLQLQTRHLVLPGSQGASQCQCLQGASESHGTRVLTHILAVFTSRPIPCLPPTRRKRSLLNQPRLRNVRLGPRRVRSGRRLHGRGIRLALALLLALALPRAQLQPRYLHLGECWPKVSHAGEAWDWEHWPLLFSF